MSSPQERWVARFVGLLGPERTLALIEAYGGRRFYVPREGASEAVLTLLGDQGALALSAELGGEYLKVPLAKRWRAVIYRERGMTYGAIAEKLGCVESTVWRHLRAAQADASPPRARDLRQTEMFLAAPARAAMPPRGCSG